MGICSKYRCKFAFLTAQPDMPEDCFHQNQCLEFDTTEKNVFITDLPIESVSISDQVKQNDGFVSVSDNPGIGITPNQDFIKEFEVNE
jgi:D-galactarolactone cycloisomerase